VTHDTKRIRIRQSRNKTNLFGVRIRDYDTKRIHGFAKRIHVFTNLLYKSRILSFSSQPPVKGSSQPPVHPVNQPRSQPDRSGFPPINAGPPAVEPRSQPVRIEPQSRSEEDNMTISGKDKTDPQDKKNIVCCPFDKLDALLSRVEEDESESEEDEPGPELYLPGFGKEKDGSGSDEPGPEDDNEKQGPPPVFQCYGPLEFVVAPEIPATVKRYRIEETTASPDHSQHSGTPFYFL
jgi:hypothetical protein